MHSNWRFAKNAYGYGDLFVYQVKYGIYQPCWASLEPQSQIKYAMNSGAYLVGKNPWDFLILVNKKVTISIHIFCKSPILFHKTQKVFQLFLIHRRQRWSFDVAVFLKRFYSNSKVLELVDYDIHVILTKGASIFSC